MHRKQPAAFAVAAFAGLALWIAPVFFDVASAPAQCRSNTMSARLTGWTLNGKTPHGTADFDVSTNKLEVAVSAVALPDGTVLDVLAGDNKIGSMQALKSGEATATITSNRLREDSRIRVLNDDRPIVSANLHCDTAEPEPTRTPEPAPSATPSVTPSVEPSATPSPGVTPSPSPAPSPTLQP